MEKKICAEELMKRLAKKFRTDKVKNANALVDVFKFLENDDDCVIIETQSVLSDIFSQLLEEGELKRNETSVPDDLKNPQQKYLDWLVMMYGDYKKKLLDQLDHSVENVRNGALDSFVRLVFVEGDHPYKPAKVFSHMQAMPKHRLYLLPIMKVLISDKVDRRPLIGKLSVYFSDFNFFCGVLNVCNSIVKTHVGKKVSIVYMENLFYVMEHVQMPENLSDDKETKIVHSNLESICMAMTRYPLTTNLYRRCLAMLPEKVMPYMKAPIKLTDFFVASYELGGSISLLALHGVFILVYKHNLIFPDFYKKLYALFEPQVFHAKYRARFFMLSNMFLTSTHLPEYLVAAFIKRLSRLMLVTPSSCLVLVIKFITNLLMRYPSLVKLINSADDEEIETDPFNAEEPDPMLCRASESSLWEVASLKRHPLPWVARAAGMVDKNLPDIEFNIAEVVETDYEEDFDRAKKIKLKEISTTFEKPNSLFCSQESQAFAGWTII